MDFLQIRFGQNSRANGAETFQPQNTDVLCEFLGDGFWMALAWIHIQP